MAVECPEGSYRKIHGIAAETFSECNLPEDDSLFPTVSNVINIFTGVLGLLAVVVTIYGGMQYLLATGDASKVKKAKDTIMYGIIGLVIAILAFAIVNFVVSIVAKDATAPAADPEEGEETSLVLTLGA